MTLELHPARWARRLAAGLRLASRFTAGGIADLLQPRVCLVCGACDHPAALPGLCPACTDALPWRDPSAPPRLSTGRRSLAAWTVALRFEPPVDDLVYRLKYGAARAAALPLGAALARAAGRDPSRERPDLLVPVPMHWAKRAIRRVDHAREIAEAVAGALRIEVDARALARRRATVAQGQARSPGERDAQVRDAFEVARPRRIRGRHVALVDDVVTSGATASACALELLRRGARRVTLLAAAGNG